LIEAVDRLLVLKDGEVIAQGIPAEILRNDEWLDRADVEPPVSLRVARAQSLAEAPLTPEEFERIVDPATPRDGKAHEETLHTEQSRESRPHADQRRADKPRAEPSDDHRPDAAPPHQGERI
jgi:ABC-type multidrug transport system ATPase subunit